MCVVLLWGAVQVGLLGCNQATAIETPHVTALSHQEAWRHGDYEISRICSFHNEPEKCEWEMSGDSEPASPGLFGFAENIVVKFAGFLFGGGP